MKLKVEEMGDHGGGLMTHKITGFSDGELRELKAMPNDAAKEKLIVLLDECNGNLGTCWACGYGIYGLWFDNEAAYLNTGKSCD